MSITGDSTWNVLDVVDRGKSLDKQPSAPTTTAGRWIVIHYEARNDGHKVIYAPPNPRIADEKGRLFGVWADKGYEDCVPGVPDDYRILQAEDVQPGVRKDYYSVYELPEDSTSLRLRLYGMQTKTTRDVALDFPPPDAGRP